MSVRKTRFVSRESGQSMIETILVLSFVLLPLLLNALNLGYFFLTVINLQAAPHTAVLYSTMGGATPAVTVLPPATSNATCTGAIAECTVSYLAYQDMAATALPNTNGAVQVCSDANGLNNVGKTTQSSVCTTSGTKPANYTFPPPHADPELNAGNTAPAFALNRVDVVYHFTPLIPGAIFNAGLRGFPACASGGTTSCCNADGTCVLHRFSEMRVMN